MADLRTPLPIHRAAFTRLGAKVGMPPAGLEALRKAFQWADRAGKPFDEMCAAVGGTVGDYDWSWPFFEESRAALIASGVEAFAWQEEGLQLDQPWDRIPHARKVRLLTSMLGAALHSERALTDHQAVRKTMPKWRLELRLDEPRCAASRMWHARMAPAIAADDLTILPPFFVGCACSLRTDMRR